MGFLEILQAIVNILEIVNAIKDLIDYAKDKTRKAPAKRSKRTKRKR